MSKYARSGPPGLYAVLDYRAGLAMSSRYAHRLHEMISFRAGREKQVERFTVEDLRARLGVQTGKLKRWPDFKVKAALLQKSFSRRASPFPR